MTKPSKLCQTCAHWEPMFTGEHWGVRSFADLSPEAQREALKDARNRQNQITSDDDGSSPLDWVFWGECALAKLESEEAKTSLARAMDGSAYMAVLKTRANFGCVQHKDLPS